MPQHYTMCHQPMQHTLLRTEHVVRVVILRLKTHTRVYTLTHMKARPVRDTMEEQAVGVLVAKRV